MNLITKKPRVTILRPGSEEKDVTKLQSKNMNDQIYVNQLTIINEEKKEKMNSKIDSVLKELEADLDSKLSQVEEEIILSMDNPSIYTSYNFSFKLQNDPQELVFKKDI